MRVLVTNDDGIEAPGLLALVTQLVAAGHAVVVAAPDRDRSGNGTAVGSVAEGTVVRFHPREIPGHPEVEAYAFTSPPAFAVLAVCSGILGPAPDIVVSGVNPGWNTGVSILHSGTVGAAMTGSTSGRPAIAVSCGPLPGSRFDTAAEVAVLALDSLTGHLRKGVVLNINVPDCDLVDLSGVTQVPLARHGIHGVRLRRDGDSVVIHERDRRHDPEDGTDSSAVQDGWVSVSEIVAGFVDTPDDMVDVARALSESLAAAVNPKAVPSVTVGG